ncbi:MAG: hypothetical protein IKG11_09830 [Atopobiaceae bacterium]|nr:hypothetical protein [Atopobiaceae bacterium]MDO4404427.1 hypothetical protein [Atopobiaceae bacterium]
MRLKTKLMLVAIPTAAVVVAGTAVAVAIHIKRKRRKINSSFLPEDVRNSLQDLCSLKGEDFVSDGVKASLYQRRLESLTDKQLIGVYVLIKAAEVLRGRGIDIHDLSKEDVVSEVSMLRDAAHNKHDRRELLSALGSIGADTARSVLSDGLILAGKTA